MRKSIGIRRLCSASTLVEAMTACAITSLFFAGLYQMNWRCLYLLKTSIDGASTSQALLNLAEQFRTSNWTEITDPNYISSTILPSASDFGHLRKVTETVDVQPYSSSGAVASQSSIQVVRNPDGSIAITTQGDGTLKSKSAVRVDLTLSWTTALNRTPHTRVISLVVSPSGMLGLN